MKKKKYIVPAIENHILPMESLMITASPGVSNEEFDPDSDEVGAKEKPFLGPSELPHYSPWDSYVISFSDIDILCYHTAVNTSFLLR